MAIVSFKHGFIFIKTRKTAGTSIEVDLSKRVGTEDIVTPIIPAVSGHIPRGHMVDGKQAFRNHMSAVEIRDRIGRERFEKLHKFCVEREPVAKCISHFHMLRNSPTHNPNGEYQLSWNEYVKAERFPVDLTFYSERKNDEWVPLVDSFLRYEDLQNSLRTLLGRYNIPDFKLTSNAKSQYSKNFLINAEQVTECERRIIYQHFNLPNKVHKLYGQPPVI